MSKFTEKNIKVGNIAINIYGVERDTCAIQYRLICARLGNASADTRKAMYLAGIQDNTYGATGRTASSMADIVAIATKYNAQISGSIASQAALYDAALADIDAAIPLQYRIDAAVAADRLRILAQLPVSGRVSANKIKAIVGGAS